MKYLKKYEENNRNYKKYLVLKDEDNKIYIRRYLYTINDNNSILRISSIAIYKIDEKGGRILESKPFINLRKNFIDKLLIYQTDNLNEAIEFAEIEYNNNKYNL